MLQTSLIAILFILPKIQNEGILDDLNAETIKITKCKSNECSEQQVDGPLKKIDPVKIGHSRKVEIAPNVERTLETVALSPIIFKMDNFLNNEECDHIKKLAEDYGLHSSDLHMDKKSLENRDYRKSSASKGSDMNYWDLNQDQRISVPEEIKQVAIKEHLLYIDDEEVDKMLKKFEVPLDIDANTTYISPESLAKVNAAGMAQYLHDTRISHPHHRDRTSDQVWLNPYGTNDTILHGIHDKLQKVTQLPKDVIEASEPFQVVRYGERGHYYAHYDSQSKNEFKELQCCQYIDDIPSGSSCRICRYLTALYFLNDPIEGGETAFPVADRKNFNEKEFMERKEGDLYNLSKFCHQASIVVKPKKGTMVLWYNHFTTDDGFLGELDKASLHGGCDVIQGEKWIATTWIPAPERDSPKSKCDCEK